MSCQYYIENLLHKYMLFLVKLLNDWICVTLRFNKFSELFVRKAPLTPTERGENFGRFHDLFAHTKRNAYARFSSKSNRGIRNLHWKYAECEPNSSQWIAENGMNWAKAHELSCGHELRWRALRKRQFNSWSAKREKSWCNICVASGINSWREASNHSKPRRRRCQWRRRPKGKIE